MTPQNALPKNNAKKLRMTMIKILLFVTNLKEQVMLKFTQGAKLIRKQIHLSLTLKIKLITFVSQQWVKI